MSNGTLYFFVADSSREARFTCGDRYDASIFTFLTGFVPVLVGASALVEIKSLGGLFDNKCFRLHGREFILVNIGDKESRTKSKRFKIDPHPSKRHLYQVRNSIYIIISTPSMGNKQFFLKINIIVKSDDNNMIIV